MRSFSASSPASSRPFSNSSPLLKVRDKTDVKRLFAIAWAILLRFLISVVILSAIPMRIPILEAAATPAITTAITADRTSAAPLNVPPSRIADWATDDISAPNCSYTFEKIGITFTNSTNSTTNSIRIIIAGYLTAFFSVLIRRSSFS